MASSEADAAAGRDAQADDASVQSDGAQQRDAADDSNDSAAGASPQRAASQQDAKRGIWRLWQRATDAVTASASAPPAPDVDAPSTSRTEASGALCDEAGGADGAESDALGGRSAVHTLLAGTGDRRGGGSDTQAQASGVAADAAGAKTTWSFKLPWWSGKRATDAGSAEPDAAANAENEEQPGTSQAGPSRQGSSARDDVDADSLPLDSCASSDSDGAPMRHNRGGPARVHQDAHGSLSSAQDPVTNGGDAAPQTEADAHEQSEGGEEAAAPRAQSSNPGADAATAYVASVGEGERERRRERANSAASDGRHTPVTQVASCEDLRAADASSAAAESRHPQPAAGTSVDADGAPPRDEAALRAALLRKRAKDLRRQLEAVDAELHSVDAGTPGTDALSPRGVQDASGGPSRASCIDGTAPCMPANRHADSVADTGHDRAKSALQANLARIQLQQEHLGDASASGSEAMGMQMLGRAAAAARKVKRSWHKRRKK